ncbi:MAG: hypothetical protein Q9227_006755, partial [Pyrenula ochraceoflavens]
MTKRAQNSLLLLPPEIRYAVLEYLIAPRPYAVTVESKQNENVFTVRFISKIEFEPYRDGKIRRTHFEFRVRDLQRARTEVLEHSHANIMLDKEPEDPGYQRKKLLEFKSSRAICDVLLTCKQLHFELLDLLFVRTTINVNHLYEAKALLAFTWLIGERTTSLIRFIHLKHNLHFDGLEKWRAARHTSRLIQGSLHRHASMVSETRDELPDPHQTSFSLPLLPGLRRLRLDLHLYTTSVFDLEIGQRKHAKPMLRFQDSGPIAARKVAEAFAPFFAWTESLPDECQIAINMNISPSSLHECDSAMEPEEQQCLQTWADHVEKALLPMVRRVETRRNGATKDPKPDASDLSPCQTLSWTEQCRQAFNFAASERHRGTSTQSADASARDMNASVWNRHASTPALDDLTRNTNASTRNRPSRLPNLEDLALDQDSS